MSKIFWKRYEWSQLLGLMLLVWFAQACHGSDSANSTLDDTPVKGYIRISVDESFKPVIDSQIKVYMASFPNTKIVAEYKPEAECLKDLESDSTRLAIVTRGLSPAESEGFEGKLGFKPPWGLIAYDAVAIVLHKQSKDSIFTLSDIRDMLAGTSGYKYKVVMDGTQATSTVRFALDSLLKGTAMKGTVEAAKSSRGVVDYVATDPNAIGMVGVSWIGNQDDPEQQSFMSKVKIASLKCETCEEDAYVKPYLGNIALGRYPLLRGLYYIVKENYNGLGRGFASFLISERGQLIFKSAYLLPGRMQFEVRNMNITQ